MAMWHRVMGSRMHRNPEPNTWRGRRDLETWRLMILSNEAGSVPSRAMRASYVTAFLILDGLHSSSGAIPDPLSVMSARLRGGRLPC